MTYQLIVARLKRVQSIPGADRIVQATASGLRVVVGSDRREGDLGVVFPSDGVLDLAFAKAAGLLARDPVTGEKLGGYLDDPPRVRCLTLRGVRTEGLWIPMDTFRDGVLEANPGYAFDNCLNWYEGAEVGTRDLWSIPGSAHRFAYVVARKYVPRTTTREHRPLDPTWAAKDAAARLERTRTRDALRGDMPEHYETPAAYKGMRGVPYGSIVYATLKVHGTSGRTCKRRLHVPAWKRAANFVAGLLGRRPYPTEEVVAGTRRTVVPANDTSYRGKIRDWLAPRLRPGECLYYEIVGYVPSHRPQDNASGAKPLQVHITRDRSADTKALTAKFGERVVYSYGCEPDGASIEPGRPYPTTDGATPMHRVFVYRITQDGVDLPHDELRRRAIEVGVEVPPVVGVWRFAAPTMMGAGPLGSFEAMQAWTDEVLGPPHLEPGQELTAEEHLERWNLARAKAAAEHVLELARLASDGTDGVRPDPLDPRHPMEGVVLRCQAHAHASEHRAFKFKSHGYNVLEGRTKDQAAEPDVEEAEDAAADG